MNKMFRWRASVLALVCLFGVQKAVADIVIVTDGETSIRIAEVRNISFEGDFKSGMLVVNYVDGTSARTPVASIQKVSFHPDDEQTPVLVAPKAPAVSVKGNMLFVDAIGGCLTVCDANGRCVMRSVLGSGVTAFSLATLPHGVYMLQVNGHSLKFVKK